MGTHKRARFVRRSGRPGVAAVETAAVLPLIVALILGAIDLGQFANCHQKISDASREAARYAAQFETQDASQVRTVVLACLSEMFPGVSEATLQANTDVTLRNEYGIALAGSELTTISAGSPVTVDVSFQFDSVRWVAGPRFLSSRTVQATTIMRRE